MLNIGAVEKLYIGFCNSIENDLMILQSMMDVTEYCINSQKNELVFNRSIINSALKVCKEESLSLLIAHTHIDGDIIFNARPSFKDLEAEKDILSGLSKENYQNRVFFSIINKYNINIR